MKTFAILERFENGEAVDIPVEVIFDSVQNEQDIEVLARIISCILEADRCKDFQLRKLLSNMASISHLIKSAECANTIVKCISSIGNHRPSESRPVNNDDLAMTVIQVFSKGQLIKLLNSVNHYMSCIRLLSNCNIKHFLNDDYIDIFMLFKYEFLSSSEVPEVAVAPEGDGEPKEIPTGETKDSISKKKRIKKAKNAILEQIYLQCSQLAGVQSKYMNFVFSNQLLLLLYKNNCDLVLTALFSKYKHMSYATVKYLLSRVLDAEHDFTLIYSLLSTYPDQIQQFYSCLNSNSNLFLYFVKFTSSAGTQTDNIMKWMPKTFANRQFMTKSLLNEETRLDTMTALSILMDNEEFKAMPNISNLISFVKNVGSSFEFDYFLVKCLQKYAKRGHIAESFDAYKTFIPMLSSIREDLALDMLELLSRYKCLNFDHLVSLCEFGFSRQKINEEILTSIQRLLYFTFLDGAIFERKENVSMAVADFIIVSGFYFSNAADKLVVIKKLVSIMKKYSNAVHFYTLADLQKSAAKTLLELSLEEYPDEFEDLLGFLKKLCYPFDLNAIMKDKRLCVDEKCAQMFINLIREETQCGLIDVLEQYPKFKYSVQLLLRLLSLSDKQQDQIQDKNKIISILSKVALSKEEMHFLAELPQINSKPIVKSYFNICLNDYAIADIKMFEHDLIFLLDKCDSYDLIAKVCGVNQILSFLVSNPINTLLKPNDIFTKLQPQLRNFELDCESQKTLKPFMVMLLKNFVLLPEAMEVLCLLLKQYPSVIEPGLFYKLLMSHSKISQMVEEKFQWFIKLLHTIFYNYQELHGNQKLHELGIKSDIVEMLVSKYQMSNSPSDRRLEQLFSVFELNLNYSLLKFISISDILKGIDSKRMIITIENFDVFQKYEPVLSDCEFPSEIAGDDCGYSPAFLLSFTLHLLNENSYSLEQIMDANLLGLTVRCLSSEDEQFRAISFKILDLVMEKFEDPFGYYTINEDDGRPVKKRKTFTGSNAMISPNQQFTQGLKQKKSIYYALNYILSAMHPFLNESETIRAIPSLSTAFFAQILKIVRNSSHPLFYHIHSFILSKPVHDCTDIPMLHELLYQKFPDQHHLQNITIQPDSAQVPRRRMARDGRKFILNLLKNCYTPADLECFNRRRVVELLSTCSSDYSQDVMMIFENVVKVMERFEVHKDLLVLIDGCLKIRNNLRTSKSFASLQKRISAFDIKEVAGLLK